MKRTTFELLVLNAEYTFKYKGLLWWVA